MWINFKGVFNKTVKKVGLARWYLKILVKKVEKNQYSTEIQRKHT